VKKVLSVKNIQELEEVKNSGFIPQHIAIIMDGNGRWAKKNGLPRVAGHRKGIKTVREIVEACANLGVKILTLYTFSTENWQRPKTEVSTLMRLIVKSLKDETDQLHKNNIKLTSIGNSAMLPKEVREELEEAFEKTKMNTKMTLNLAISYSGRWELTNAVQNIVKDVKDGKIEENSISEDTISEYLNTSGMPDPELLIRSGGDMRISNFLLWQIAYSEIFVTNVLWPKFNTTNLIQAVKDFQNRERRFGLVSEQITKDKKIEKNDKLT